jgi:3-phenylpropionate/trans-cinnamate dioxygenase ferredoxin reductase subunit
VKSQADVVIVGTGHGGVAAAIKLRQRGFAGSILMVTADHDLPYERPPLSKDYLAGEKDYAGILARPEAFWAEREIGLLRSEEVLRVDPSARVLGCASGREIAYGKLVWAAGGSARRLAGPGGQLAGVHSIRSRADVDALRTELPDADRVVVIGGGYVGLEAAAVLRKLGKQVVVLESGDRVLARVAARSLSEFVAAEHRANGVDVRTGIEVGALEGDGRVKQVRLADGSAVTADLVIVGIGIDPIAAPLLESGAEGREGVLVDEHCRTSLPDVWVVGDCALHRNRFGPDQPVRIESVQNAADMGTVAALDIAGQPQPYSAMPWFWSNQYDLRLQTVGLNHGFDEALVRGDPASRKFSVIYRREGQVIALDCVNNVRDYVQGRLLIEGRSTVDAALLTDPERQLKNLAA